LRPAARRRQGFSGTIGAGGDSFTGGIVTYFVGTLECVPVGLSVIGRRCGNGVLDPGEQCDDANFLDGDCCSATCSLDAFGTSCTGSDVCLEYACDGAGSCVAGGPSAASCDDGLFCNGVDTCSAGVCMHSGDPCAGQDTCHACDESADQCLSPPGFRCAACSVCDSTRACVGTPLDISTCRLPQEAQLAIVNRTPDTRDKLAWKWNGFVDVFGMPTVDEGYALCVFDASSGALPYPLLMSARAPAGSDWKQVKRGFKYRSRSDMPDGLAAVTLTTPSPHRGDRKISLKGKKDLLPLPSSETPLPLPLLVQLQTDSGRCFQAGFGTVDQNDGTKFKAKLE